ncbi:amino acid ABC transporter permease [Hydrogenophaga taeniospiralis]|jgi:polar amino acid transport system permease protein|uniref:amino acid ABC transporter permease n=1 Tax=Hydrogenophaga taeniospiralis TaxID=65656 RepID=UPI0008C91017|nr:amino acid ABC transporter permease [Hydrogenophaga taeniospiralis]OGB16974.1 MAG: polar amino acid ABC transporter permease [Burkholderiales bacterium RIFCSPLOWO2_02_FULL_67_64]OGB41899.1 MAG: polar amino acid ABC transporter permease [Burkholderiales bacterium RIFCSPHIGHO2_12_FULL_67_38]OGB45258.1 MAG: polar amino acid ABC transporter permease [Burkholderiales bacterium RIFCSPLOWO2_12_67_14]OGB78157.1 MAG: polar amino acid ABC transporter permease [Burkholderiales bacterium RIFCSPLOWO2_12_
MRIELDFIAVLLQWPLLAKGVLWTLGLTAISAVIGLVVGTLCAWARSSGPLWLRWVVGCYVELIRNTPFIVQLFFVFFGLPAAGVKLTPEIASVIAMVINLGAYAAEIVRAGIDATPKGQFEAAASLALSRVQTFLHVVLPPALQKVWPALTSQIIIVMLGSAVCGQISTEELSYAANLIQSRNFRAFEAFIVATGIYLLLSVGVRALLNWAGPRYLFGGRRG